MRLVVRYVVIGELECDLQPGLGNKSEPGLFRICRHAEKVDLLEVGSLVSGRGQTIALELCGNPVGGHIAALLPGAATLQCVVRKVFHRRADLLRVNGIHRLLRGWGRCDLSECRGYANYDDRQKCAESFHYSSLG